MLPGPCFPPVFDMRLTHMLFLVTHLCANMNPAFLKLHLNITRNEVAQKRTAYLHLTDLSVFWRGSSHPVIYSLPAQIKA